MDIVGVAARVVHLAAIVFFYLLWARVVLDLIRQLRRDWKPRGPWLAVSVAILSVTDPPLRVARRIIRPVRVGGAAIDFAMLALMLVVIVLMYVMAMLY